MSVEQVSLFGSGVDFALDRVWDVRVSAEDAAVAMARCSAWLLHLLSVLAIDSPSKEAADAFEATRIALGDLRAGYYSRAMLERADLDPQQARERAFGSFCWLGRNADERAIDPGEGLSCIAQLASITDSLPSLALRDVAHEAAARTYANSYCTLVTIRERCRFSSSRSILQPTLNALFEGIDRAWASRAVEKGPDPFKDAMHPVVHTIDEALELFASERGVLQSPVGSRYHRMLSGRVEALVSSGDFVATAQVVTAAFGYAVRLREMLLSVPARHQSAAERRLERWALASIDTGFARFMRHFARWVQLRDRRVAAGMSELHALLGGPPMQTAAAQPPEFELRQFLDRILAAISDATQGEVLAVAAGGRMGLLVHFHHAVAFEGVGAAHYPPDTTRADRILLDIGKALDTIFVAWVGRVLAPHGPPQIGSVKHVYEDLGLEGELLNARKAHG